MGLYRFADTVVEIRYKYSMTDVRCKRYRIDEDVLPDFSVFASDERIYKLLAEAPNLDVETCEYMILCSDYYSGLLEYNGMMLHASAVALDGNAYLFSAPSGVGKSTHTRLWQEYFGEERAIIINDDKPAIRCIDGGIFAYGTPFSGKYDISANIRVPIKAITFVNRAPENKIELLPQNKAIAAILNQTIRPNEIEKMDLALNVIEKIVESVPIYSMGCNISYDAVKLSYATMSGIQ